MTDDPTRELVSRAADFAREKHEGQLRDDGRPYVTHPEAVVRILQAHGCGAPEVLAAAWLHDVVEDTGATIDEIHQRFGPVVARLVAELTREPYASGSTFEERQRSLLDHCRRMSPEAAVVKLADRYHNVSTMDRAWPAWKTRRYLKATEQVLEILQNAEPRIAREIRDLSAQIAEGLHDANP